jgi:hypothetical protein
MRRKLMISCPQCEGGDSKFFYEQKLSVCSYCNGLKKVNIFDHHHTLGIADERHTNVAAFVSDPRFTEYLEAKSKKR